MKATNVLRFVATCYNLGMYRDITRREMLRLLLAAGAGLLTSCATRALSPSPHPTALATSSVIAPTPTASPTSAPATAAPSDLIKQVVVFIQENHTFDSLFAGFPGVDGRAAPNACANALPADPPHQHVDALTPDGATTSASNCSYTEADIPNYWRIAREFVLCDRFFSDVRGPSHPNYLMLMAAQSPIVNTPVPSDVCPAFCLDIPTIVDRLDEAQLTWHDYGGLFTDIKRLVGRVEISNSQDAQFFSNAANGTLPNVAWLNSGFVSDARSGHPPSSLCEAENYAVKVLNAIMNGPQWNSTVVFLVWDDWGGFYDHVAPPIVERLPDGTPFRYGFRVPCLAISPYARSGYVSHQTHSFVSLLRFIETIFDLPPLTERDAQASDMLDCFDFSQAPRPPIHLTPRICPSG